MWDRSGPWKETNGQADVLPEGDTRPSRALLLFLQGDASCPLKDLFDHNLCFESGEWRRLYAEVEATSERIMRHSSCLLSFHPSPKLREYRCE